MKTLIRSAGLLLVAIAGLGIYTVIDGSPGQTPFTERRKPPVETPVAKDHIRIKLVMLINGDHMHVATNNIPVRYYYNGKWTPEHGAYTTKRYWWRILDVKKGDTVMVQAVNNDGGNIVVDVAIYREHVAPGQNRILAHNSTRNGIVQCSAVII